MEVWFTARRKFDPSFEVDWEKYIQWANLPQLQEVISLDTVLCPSMFHQLIDEDWNWNVHQDHRISYFRNLDYVIDRVKANSNKFNVLAVTYEPALDPKNTFHDSRFEFCGFDLIGDDSDISAINNCGGFEKAFDNTDVSAVGLFQSYAFTRDVQRKLRDNYPDEHHANCELWAVWRLRNFDK